jgi:hypothetical protein
MARGRGQIPSYGANFRLESLAWSPERANRAYVLKRDPAWFIRSDKTSGAWTVYWITPGTGASFETATPMGKPLPTLTKAMTRLLDGIAGGFYPAAS